MKINLPPVSSTTEPAVHYSFRPTIMGIKRLQKILAVLTLYVAIELHYGTAFWGRILTHSPTQPCNNR